jgi:sugar phosphate isomerase/epimerase
MTRPPKLSRRRAIASTLGAIAAASYSGMAPSIAAAKPPKRGDASKIKFGLVTYMWGAGWDLPTLLANCEKAGALGVELRTEHAHGVEPTLNAAQRKEVRERFAESPIKLVGLGCNEDFHDPDAASLRQSIDRAQAFIKLSHDVGGSGVKVKPNDLPPGVPRERTIEQIGRSLNELAKFASYFDQQVRLEVHGGCAHLPTIAAIMQVADHPNAVVCWNSNPQDLEGEGLDHNFRLVQDRLGSTVHVRQLNGGAYPNARLIELLKNAHYKGWLLIEDGAVPKDVVAALQDQRRAFEKLLSHSERSEESSPTPDPSLRSG